MSFENANENTPGKTRPTCVLRKSVARQHVRKHRGLLILSCWLHYARAWTLYRPDHEKCSRYDMTKN